MKRKAACVALLVMMMLSMPVMAEETRIVRAARFSTRPTIDGQLDEAAWRMTEAAEGLIQFQPHNGEPSPLRTTASFGFDDEALYVAFTCHDPEPLAISAALTKRDSDLRNDDCVGLFLDTLNDDHTGTAFATNLLGTQWDFRISDNGRSSDSNWDGAWTSAAARTEDGWTAEMAIPFRILKYKGGTDQTWGLNFCRTYPRNLEKSYWAAAMLDELRISQYGELTGLDLPARVKPYELIPYALSQFERGAAPSGKAGMDVSYRVSSTLGANLTINPDFATIEADAEEINLTRFERWIDEKRPFFLEGGEMFEQRMRQFYSRRIGDIPWGAKLNGNIDGLDLAFISARSDPAETAGDSANVGKDATYTVLRIKKGIFGSSNVGFLAANRSWRGDNQGTSGLDVTLFFTGALGMTAQLIRAHGPRNNGALAWFLRPAYDSADSHFHLRYSNWDKGMMENFNAAGYAEDDDRREISSMLSHTFWPKGGGVERVGTEVHYERYWGQNGVLRSWNFDAEVEIELTSKWDFEISREDEYKLYEKSFDNEETGLELGYDTRAGRRAEVYYRLGRSFESDHRLFGGSLDLKLTDAWNIDYDLSRLWLDPDPEEETTWIHALHTNYYLTTDFYLKLFFQTNSSIDKKNTQAVLVWRFLPPFGSLQIAYQKGTSRAGTRSDQGDTLFTKLSWVF